MWIIFTEILSHQLFACCCFFFFKTISQVCLVAACLKKFNAVWFGNAVGCTQKIVGIKESKLKKKYLFYFSLYSLWIAKNNEAKLRRMDLFWYFKSIYLYMFSHFP